MLRQDDWRRGARFEAQNLRERMRIWQVLVWVVGSAFDGWRDSALRLGLGTEQRLDFEQRGWRRGWMWGGSRGGGGWLEVGRTAWSVAGVRRQSSASHSGCSTPLKAPQMTIWHALALNHPATSHWLASHLITGPQPPGPTKQTNLVLKRSEAGNKLKVKNLGANYARHKYLHTSFYHTNADWTWKQTRKHTPMISRSVTLPS